MHCASIWAIIMLSFMAGLTDGLAKLAGEIANPSLKEMIPLEAIEDNRTLCLKDGTLASMIWLRSKNDTVEERSAIDCLSRLRFCFIPFLKHHRHSFEVSFIRNPGPLRDKLELSRKIKRKKCLQMRLEIGNLLDEQCRFQVEELTEEMVILTLYTWSPMFKGRKQLGRGEDQSFEAVQHEYDSYEKHLAMTDCLARDLTTGGYVINQLNVDQYLHHAKMGLYPQQVPKAARLFEHPSCIENHVTKYRNSLDDKLSREDVHILDDGLVKIGNHVFGGFDITLLPEFIVPFNELIRSVADSHPEIPFRCSFKFDGIKPNVMKVKEQYVKFFGFTNPLRHKKIRSAFEQLKEDEGIAEDLIRLRIGFATWLASSDIRQFRHNLSFLRNSTEQWGNITTDRNSGDSLATILYTIPGFGPISTAPEVLVPLGEALKMFPLARQTSPWTRGETMFRSTDGVAWPYQRGSMLQSSWLEILIGSSGSGKSVALNALNLGSVLDGTALDLTRVELPKVVIVDVGNSSAGLIRVLREALPPERKNEAVHLEFKLLPEYTINPFDTPLGFRKPLGSHRNFLINFLSILVKETSFDTAIDLAGILGILIEKTYERFADWESPKRYYRGEEENIDRLLDQTRFDFDEHTSWWEVTDWLFAQGYQREANLAQTRAVPILTDLIQVLFSPNFTASAGGQDDTNEKAMGDLISYLQIRFSEAVRDFPIIGSTTKFDIGEAKVMSMDVGEVLDKIKGFDSQRSSSLMYMLARHVAIGNWEVDEKEVLSMVEREDVPEAYKGYHLQRTQSDRGQPKVLCIDEYHRAGDIREINNQLIRDAREGRKRNYRITLASQFVNDFDAEILNLASTILVFGNQLPNEVRNLKEWFPLSRDAEEIMTRELTGPTSDGSPFLGIFRTKEGTIMQKLVLKLCPGELWEFSTTAEDVMLRESAYKAFGVTDGRKKLSQRFPAGTARNKILSLSHSTERSRGEGCQLDGQSTVIEKIIKELYTVDILGESKI